MATENWVQRLFTRAQPIDNVQAADASIHGERAVMGALLHGARSADLSIQDEDGETAAHWAAWAGHAEVLDLLLIAKARTDLQDNDGRTAWGRAHMYGQDACIRVLTAHGVRA